MLEDNGCDEEETEMDLMMQKIAAMRITRKEKEDRGIKERGWIPNIVKEVRQCVGCHARIEKGLKCGMCRYTFAEGNNRCCLNVI
jgi:hypothetical protein